MQSSYLLINELRVHYLRWNRGGSRLPVVLLHGLASNARIWELVAPNLVDADHDVLALDLRGHGLTDKPDGDYGFDTFHRDLAGFIDALDLERPLLVGHSWGASLALDYAARKSIGSRSPSGIVLVDGGMSQLDQVPGATWESTRQRLTPPRLAGMPVDAFVERVQNANSRWQLDDQAIQIILANFDIREDDTISPRLSFDHHMQIVRAMWEFKTYERYDQVRCPVVLAPARPPAPRSQAEAEFLASKEQGLARIQSHHPGVKVYWQEDTIHDIPLQSPVELAQLIVQFAASL
jgi:pimeloyl-ACP methyl ester carboxylesterase